MSNVNYFVRQKTIQVPNSSFKLVKLYARPDDTERLTKAKREEVTFAEDMKLEDAYSRELLEVVVESNFNAGDYVLSYAFPSKIAEDARTKELSSFFSRLRWTIRTNITYVYRSERDTNGELYFTILLCAEDKITEDALMRLCGKGHSLKIDRITRDKNGLITLPASCGSIDGCKWSCSKNIKRPVITIEDGTIVPDVFEDFLKAKVGEDVSPYVHKMFGSKQIDIEGCFWDMTHSRFTSLEYGKDSEPCVEIRLVKKYTFVCGEAGCDSKCEGCEYDALCEHCEWEGMCFRAHSDYRCQFDTNYKEMRSKVIRCVQKVPMKWLTSQDQQNLQNNEVS